MKYEEKKLIEDLFHRLKKTGDNQIDNRDELAASLITSFLEKQPDAPYYMTQTLLIQEIALKKLNLKINELEKIIATYQSESKNKSKGFLSSFLKNSNKDRDTIDNLKTTNSEKSVFSDNRSVTGNIISDKKNVNDINHSSPLSTPNYTRSGGVGSGFLGNALQTAAGVAGGMVMANMLMNLFQHKKPEEEVFNTVNDYSSYSILNADSEQLEHESNNDSRSDDHRVNDHSSSSLESSSINDISQQCNTNDNDVHEIDDEVDSDTFIDIHDDDNFI